MALSSSGRRWRSEMGRISVGFFGGLLNGIGVFSTIVGWIAQEIRDQDGGTEYAVWLHLGYAVANGALMYFLLSQLGDEERPAAVPVAAWTVATGCLWIAYWSWVL